MMQYRIQHLTKYTYTDAVPVCHNLVHLAPRQLPNQVCNDFELTVTPKPVEVVRHYDAFGNPVDYFAIHDPHRTLSVISRSEVKIEPSQHLQQTTNWESIVAAVREPGRPEYLDACQFTYPSRYVQLSEEFAEYARISFQPRRDIVEATLDLTARFNQEFVYDPRATTLSTPVRDVFRKRSGVCQDFAHLQIACLRSLGVPARYASGYLRTLPPGGRKRLLGADASHAWLAVFCGDAGWLPVDPTNNVVPEADHITVAFGRDYQDVCPVRGVFIGGGRHSLAISVDVDPI